MQPLDTGEAPSTGTSFEVYGASFSPTNDFTAANIDSGSPYDKSFAENVYSLLHVPSYSSIISWNRTGTAVIIHDVDAFISTIMPVHFRHSQFNSFTRRLRRWGFSVIRLGSSPSEHGESSVLEFSSKNFLRDRPELCSLMKDERQGKKKFKLKGSNTPSGVAHNPPSPSSKGGNANPLFESTQPLPVYHPPHNPPTPLSKIGNANPSFESTHSLPIHYPPPPSIALNSNTTQNQLEMNQLQQSGALLPANMKSTGNVDFRSVAANNDGYLHNYQQERPMPSMITPNKHAAVSAMNNMMPPPSFQYPPPPYGQNASSVGLGQGQGSPAFRYPPPYGYSPHQPEQEQQKQQRSKSTFHIQKQQRNHHRRKPQQQQQQQQFYQHYPPLPPTAESFFRNADARASVESGLVASLSLSSSDESQRGMDLLPTRKISHTHNKAHSQEEDNQIGQKGTERESEE